MTGAGGRGPPDSLHKLVLFCHLFFRAALKTPRSVPETRLARSRLQVEYMQQV